jgi:hypothetical protein
MPNFKSWRSYWDFEVAVRRGLRYLRSAETDAFLSTVLATSKQRQVEIKKGQIFWRAQLGHDWREEGDDPDFEVPCAYSPARMKPLRDRAEEGRVNAKGIPCLYLSTRKETAISEVRPWIDSYISVGQFKLIKTITVIDCSKYHNKTPLFLEEPSEEKIEKAVWSHIDRAFSEPMARRDNIADYVPTQIIAELFKREGFGGVAYKSNFGDEGYNIAIFDIDAAVLINCGLYKITGIDIKFSEQDNPYFVSKHYNEPKG